MNDRNFIFDGAFGTYFHKLTQSDLPCERANIENPSIVGQIHSEYISAGANAIKTNTFNTCEPELIRAGWNIAVEAAGDKAVVFADIGYKPHRGDTADFDPYTEIAKIFIECGAENFLFETLEEFEPIIPAINYIRTVSPNAYIIVSFAVSQDGYTRLGKYYKDLIRAALCQETDTVGLNCVCGPAHIHDLICSLDLNGISFSAMPNAGYPAKVDGRLEYRDNPEYFADRLVGIRKLGVSIVGGCCGTTPEHIHLMNERIKDIVPEIKPVVQEAEKYSKTAESPFAESLKSGKFTVAVELDPPLDTDISHLISSASRLKTAGADAITLADSPLARARADSMMTAAKVKRETGIDTIPHLACRDKNSLALKASLIAANIEKVQNVLTVTGDSIKSIDSRDDNVFVFNSLKLISYIKSMNDEIFTNSPYLIAGALNVNAVNFKSELKRASQKLSNGADVLFTQVIFSEESIENLKLARQALDCKIMAGILPIASYKNAVFLNNEVSGITVPDSVIKALEGKAPDEVKKISLDYSRRMIDTVRPYCNGIYLMTPLKKVDFVCELTEYIAHFK